MKPPPYADMQTLYEMETAKFRAFLAKGRSSNQVALFDLLVERSVDERSPKEVEIALALFGNNSALDNNSDSGIRVYVHRLRKRMDDYYSGKTGPRLVLPKGEYRILLEEVEEPEPPLSLLTRSLRLFMANPALSVGLCLIVFAAILFASWQWSTDDRIASRPANDRQTLFGATSGLQNPVIAVGDSLLLAETKDQRSVQRMVLDRTIQTRDEFGNFLKAHPETFYQLYDFDLRFAPIETIEAAWKVQGDLSSPKGAKGQEAPLVPVSSLSADTFQAHDVIYVGRLSQLGVLDQYVFARSNFRLTGYNRLLDTQSRNIFQGEVYTNAQSNPKPDYGFLSVRKGPLGRRLIIFAGLGDRGTAAMTDMLTNPDALLELKKRLGMDRLFEAVFEIKTPVGMPPQQRLIALYTLS